MLGKSYEKKTSMAMCSELGPEGDHYMQDYVLEASGTSLCSIEPPHKGCSEKEIGFIGKAKALDAAGVDKQVTRLEKMSGGKMNEELKNWLNQRLAILRQLQKSAAGGSKDEL